MKTYPFLTELLIEEFGVRAEEIRPDATPAELGLDSLSMIEIIAALEEEFEIEFEKKQLAVSTLGEAASVADRLIGEGRPGK